jgi:A/G-specific adenine glycosylase
MDYGTYIKKTFGNPNSRSKQYAVQSTFRGSDRQIRGALLRLITKKEQTRKQLLAALDFEDIRIDAQLHTLLRDGLLQKQGAKFILPT